MRISCLTFILLVTFSINSYASDSKAMANKLVDSLLMVELTLNAALPKLSSNLGDMPDKEYGLRCFENDYRPKIRKFFSEAIHKSLDDDALREGFHLVSKPGVESSKEVILASAVENQPKSKNIRADVYQFRMAAEASNAPLAKKELFAVSEWLKVNGPVFGKALADNMIKYVSIMKGSLNACFIME